MVGVGLAGEIASGVEVPRDDVVVPQRSERIERGAEEPTGRLRHIGAPARLFAKAQAETLLVQVVVDQPASPRREVDDERDADDGEECRQSDREG